MEINSGEDQQHDQEPSQWFVKYLDKQSDWLEKTRGNLMVAATVIASMSFQVMVNPPGGVWQSDDCSSKNLDGTCKAIAGTAVLQMSKYELYNGMVISSTISFTASMSLILLVIIGPRLRNKTVMVILVTFMVIAVLCMSAAFFYAVALVQSNNHMIIRTLLIYLAFWLLFPVLIIIILIIKFICWLICCCCCRRPRQPPTRPFVRVVPPPAQ